MADGVLALMCEECLLVFGTIEKAEQHLRDDERGCGQAQGLFSIVEEH